LFAKFDHLFVKEEADMDDHKNGGKFLVTRAKEVEFLFHRPKAMKVFLVGEFNSWEAESLPMQEY
jgi:1,4-alpha-glucan branching enzyme